MVAAQGNAMWASTSTSAPMPASSSLPAKHGSSSLLVLFALRDDGW